MWYNMFFGSPPVVRLVRLGVVPFRSVCLFVGSNPFSSVVARLPCYDGCHWPLLAVTPVPSTLGAVKAPSWPLAGVGWFYVTAAIHKRPAAGSSLSSCLFLTHPGYDLHTIVTTEVSWSRECSAAPCAATLRRPIAHSWQLVARLRHFTKPRVGHRDPLTRTGGRVGAADR